MQCKKCQALMEITGHGTKTEEIPLKDGTGKIGIYKVATITYSCPHKTIEVADSSQTPELLKVKGE